MKTRAFTLIELLVVLSVVGVLLAITLPSLGGSRVAARKLKDGVQIRTIHQGMIVWSGQHRDWFPLPSLIDLNDTIPGIDSTVRPCGELQQWASVKDLPRWIISLLLFNGVVSPESCVSPGEVNPLIEINRVYEFNKPSAVAESKRNQAVLDPAFACYPYEDGGDIAIASARPFAPAAGFSYAISPPIGKRRQEWKATGSPSNCVLGNRGPWYQRDDRGAWVLDPFERRGQPDILAKESNSLRFWGSRSDWAGNIVRNDNSVAFETRPDPESCPLPFSEGGTAPRVDRQVFDNLFVSEDETSDARNYTLREEIDCMLKWKNNFLRCYGGNGDSWRHAFEERACPMVPTRIWFD